LPNTPRRCGCPCSGRWPLAAAEIAEAELKPTARSAKFLGEAGKIDFGLRPQFTIENDVALDLSTMKLGKFALPGGRSSDSWMTGRANGVASLENSQQRRIAACGT
jgi:hypothetical protein